MFLSASIFSCFMRKSFLMIVFAMVLFSCCSWLGFADDPGRSDESLARIWTEKAANLLVNPDFNRLIAANEALDVAEEFFPPGPDALYLRARIVLDNRLPQKNDIRNSHIRQAEALSRASLDFDPERLLPPQIPFEERALLYSRLALRLKKYSDLLNQYETWPRGNRDSIPLVYAAARAALYLGLNKQAAEMAMRGEALTSDEDSLTVFGMNLDDPRPAFRAIATASGEDKAIEAFGRVIKKWGETMEMALMPWIKSGIMDTHEVQKIRKYLNSENNIIVDLLSGLHVSPEVLSTVTDFLPLARQAGISIDNVPDNIIPADYTGIINTDVNYDGYDEEVIVLQNGEVKSRRVDTDQDGVDEWNIAYEGGFPLKVSLDNDLLIVIYEAGDYPAISKLINDNPLESLRGEAVFQTGVFTWEIGNGDPGFGPLVRPGWNDSGLWPFLKSVTIHAVLPETGETGKATTWFVKGYPVKATEMRFSGLNQDNPLWIRKLLFEDGVIIAGLRSVRMKGNTRLWEIYERYEKGRFVGLAWAPGADSRPVYWEDWALEPWLRTQVWNLDADGWMDVRRFVTARAGKDVRELYVGEARQKDLLPWNAEEWEPWE